MHEFSTDKVYDEIIRDYIKEPKSNEYQKYVQFMKDPYSKFESHVNNLKKLLLDSEIEGVHFKKYTDSLRKNYTALSKRLNDILDKVSDKKEALAETMNLFVIEKNG